MNTPKIPLRALTLAAAVLTTTTGAAFGLSADGHHRSTVAADADHDSRSTAASGTGPEA